MDSISSLNINGIPGIIFGAGKFSELPKMIELYGREALMITGGESLKRHGRLNTLAVQLGQNHIKHSVVSVWEEPTTQAIDAVVLELRKTPFNVVVAIGGGSVIDFGKAVSAMLTADGSVKDYLEGVGTKSGRHQDSVHCRSDHGRHGMRSDKECRDLRPQRGL